MAGPYEHGNEHSEYQQLLSKGSAVWKLIDEYLIKLSVIIRTWPEDANVRWTVKVDRKGEVCELNELD